MHKMKSNLNNIGSNINHNTGKVEFNVFAYNREQVDLVVKIRDEVKKITMNREKPHLFHKEIDIPDETLLYKYRLDDKDEFPDPYSYYQPFGVHGLSQLIDHSRYQWRSVKWHGSELKNLIIMEIHVGTFTSAGTFKGVADQLDYLVDLGINAIELMPVTQTPGRWNWGYDGANLFSVNHNYGTPDDLKFLIDNCHFKDIAVILDVVYNHFGPEGNYLPQYGPYFTHKHQTPWGDALNYDDSYCEFTRNMVLNNVTYWLENYRFDGLRLDAVHTIKDSSEVHILQEISQTVNECSQRQKRKMFVIAESDENNILLIKPRQDGGYGIDAQWMDDFHHCVHTALTAENNGYYMDYGRLSDFEKVYKNFLYTGEHSLFLEKARGTDASAFPGRMFIVAIQNHDQVGNRAQGDRLSTIVEFPYLKVAAGLMFFTAYIPLLFMGEEYGEKNPFLFFTDYINPDLQKDVSRGRAEEFKEFTWTNVPDPQNEGTFSRSILTTRDQWDSQNKQLFSFYKDLIYLRKNHPVLNTLDKKNLIVTVNTEQRSVIINRWQNTRLLTGFFNLGDDNVTLDGYKGIQLLNSEWKAYGGSEDGIINILKKGQMIIFETTPEPSL